MAPYVERRGGKVERYAHTRRGRGGELMLASEEAERWGGDAHQRRWRGGELIPARS